METVELVSTRFVLGVVWKIQFCQTWWQLKHFVSLIGNSVYPQDDLKSDSLSL